MKSIIIFNFGVFVLGRTHITSLLYCMEYRFEPTKSRLLCGEVPSLI